MLHLRGGAILDAVLPPKGGHFCMLINNKRVLSLIFLALEAIRSGYLIFISQADLLEIKQNGLHDEIIGCSNFVGIT